MDCPSVGVADFDDVVFTTFRTFFANHGLSVCSGTRREKASRRSLVLRRGSESVDIIRIGLKQQCDAVEQPADAKQTEGEEVEDTQEDPALIEFVSAEIAEE